jgi:hypothetical protein
MDESNRRVSQRSDDGKWIAACPSKTCTQPEFGERYISWSSGTAADTAIRDKFLFDRLTGEEVTSAERVTTGENASVEGVGQARLSCERSAKEPPPQRKF